MNKRARLLGFASLAGTAFLLTLAFNSCQEGLRSGVPSSSSLDNTGAGTDTESQETDFTQKYCKQSLENSSKLNANEVFAERKVQIAEKDFGPSGKLLNQKLMKLVVLLDPTCVEESLVPDDSDSVLSFSQRVAEGKRLLSDLKVQAFAYDLPLTMSIAQLENLAEKDHCVRGISEDQVFQLQSVGDAFDDEHAGRLKHLDAIEAGKAFEILYGAEGLLQSSTDSQSKARVKIAVIDSGVDVEHPDLKSRIWQFAKAGSSDVKFRGVDATTLLSEDPSYNPSDPTGHGTHVAGLISAQSNNQIGGLGVMPYQAEIMAIKAVVKDSQGEYVIDTPSAINAIRWAALNGADVINLGHGTKVSGEISNPAYLDAIKEVIALGVTVVGVSGNSLSGGALLDGVSNSSIPGIFGSGHEGMLTVGASDADTQELASFSMYSPKNVEILAPGTQSHAEESTFSPGLISTVPTELFTKDYLAQEGTSMSGALVSGSAGLVISWIRMKTGTTPHPCVVEGVIKESSQRSEALKAYAQEGRHLNLYNLASYLKTKWP